MSSYPGISQYKSGFGRVSFFQMSQSKYNALKYLKLYPFMSFFFGQNEFEMAILASHKMLAYQDF